MNAAALFAGSRAAAFVIGLLVSMLYGIRITNHLHIKAAAMGWIKPPHTTYPAADGFIGVGAALVCGFLTALNPVVAFWQPVLSDWGLLAHAQHRLWVGPVIAHIIIVTELLLLGRVALHPQRSLIWAFGVYILMMGLAWR